MSHKSNAILPLKLLLLISGLNYCCNNFHDTYAYCVMVNCVGGMVSATLMVGDESCPSSLCLSMPSNSSPSTDISVIDMQCSYLEI